MTPAWHRIQKRPDAERPLPANVGTTNWRGLPPDDTLKYTHNVRDNGSRTVTVSPRKGSGYDILVRGEISAEPQ